MLFVVVIIVLIIGIIADGISSKLLMKASGGLSCGPHSWQMTPRGLECGKCLKNLDEVLRGD